MDNQGVSLNLSSWRIVKNLGIHLGDPGIETGEETEFSNGGWEIEVNVELYGSFYYTGSLHHARLTWYQCFVRFQWGEVSISQCPFSMVIKPLPILWSGPSRIWYCPITLGNVPIEDWVYSAACPKWRIYEGNTTCISQVQWVGGIVQEFYADYSINQQLW